MKKVANILLMFSLPVAIAGALFRTMHWTGGNILLVNGLPMVAIASLLKYAADKTLEGYVLGFTVAVACIGVLFKLEHWPNSEWIIRIAIGGAIVWVALSFRGDKGETQ